MNPLIQLKHELRIALHGLDISQMQLRTPGRPDSWTIQQICEHLRLTYVKTHEAMGVRIAKGVATKTRVTPTGRAVQALITRLGYFPRKRAAPAIVRPGTLEPLCGEVVFAAMAADLDAMSAAIDEVEQLLGRGRIANHAVMGPMSMAQWRRFHLVHGRHHMRQILLIRS